MSKPAAMAPSQPSIVTAAGVIVLLMLSIAGGLLLIADGQQRCLSRGGSVEECAR